MIPSLMVWSAAAHRRNEANVITGVKDIFGVCIVGVDSNDDLHFRRGKTRVTEANCIGQVGHGGSRGQFKGELARACALPVKGE